MSEKKDAAKAAADQQVKIKNMRITVDATEVEDSLDIGYGLNADDHYGPLDWDMESTDTAATGPGKAEGGSKKPKAGSVAGGSSVVTASDAPTSVLQEDNTREVTFKVTMDEKKTQELLYGKGGRRPPQQQEQQPPEDAEDGEMSDESGRVSDDDEESSLSESEKIQPFVLRKKPKPMDLDMTAPDVNDPEVKKVRKARAERFGIKDTQEDTVVEPEKLSELYKEFSVSGHARVDRYFLNKLNVRGVDELNTYDIMRYFGDFYPTHIEWVNDSACNVVFRNDEWAANCMLKMSKPLQRVKRPRTHEDGEIPSSSDDEAGGGATGDGGPAAKKTRNKRFLPDAERVSDDERSSSGGGSDTEQAGTSKEKYVSVMKRQAEAEAIPDDPKPSDDTEMTAEKPPNETWTDRAERQQTEQPQHLQDLGDAIAVDVRQCEVPPGRWRVCIKHCPKAEVLLIRFASVRDVKEENAQWKSEYYRKYGNPNFTGLMSQSLKRRLQGDLRTKLEPPERSSWMRRDKVRTGMNVFDNDGNELDWDYEHDTRFYDANKFNQRSQALDTRLGKRRRSSGAAAAASSSSDEDEDKEKDKDKEDDQPVKRKKRVGMGMRADQEAEKAQRRRSTRSRSSDSDDWNAARKRTRREMSEERWPQGQMPDSDSDQDRAGAGFGASGGSGGRSGWMARGADEKSTSVMKRRSAEQSKQPWDPPELSRMKVTVANPDASAPPAGVHDPDSDWSIEAEDIV